MDARMWDNLIAEIQFARELTMDGIRRLCAVRPTTETFFGQSRDQIYAVQVGLYSYVAGLERLCKLTIACSGYGQTGEFPRLKRFNHGLADLLAEVNKIVDEQQITVTYADRPSGGSFPELEAMIDRVASGKGRYEHLDSLWNNEVQVNTFEEWCRLASSKTVSESIKSSLLLQRAMQAAMRDGLAHMGLETAAQEVLSDFEIELHEPSIGVALDLFRITRWVSVILGQVAVRAIHLGVPRLSEGVNRYFVHPSSFFFSFHIARIADEYVVVEELEGFYEQGRSEDEFEEGVSSS